MTSRTPTPRYFLKTPWTTWVEVTKDQFVLAERGAGFVNTMGAPNEPGTGGFGHELASGRVIDDHTQPSGYDWDPEFRDAVWPPS